MCWGRGDYQKLGSHTWMVKKLWKQKEKQHAVPCVWCQGCEGLEGSRGQGAAGGLEDKGARGWAPPSPNTTPWSPSYSSGEEQQYPNTHQGCSYLSLGTGLEGRSWW